MSRRGSADLRPRIASFEPQRCTGFEERRAVGMRWAVSGLSRTEKGDAYGIPEFTFVLASCCSDTDRLLLKISRNTAKSRPFLVSALLLQRAGLREGRPHRVRHQRHVHDRRTDARIRTRHDGKTTFGGHRRAYLCHPYAKRLPCAVCLSAGNRIAPFGERTISALALCLSNPYRRHPASAVQTLLSSAARRPLPLW